ncbi:Arc family DNA-binding protein [Hyphomicrobium sp. LHD-15]|uniref:Arc family DNA-binding protein n=1 Tax=Hyphomicrobium sp. LHD-15 TaxID=3072142 RepID=UPI00280E8142|nr:Arc family DNA-binding protein [Hyphomicrobium sp. LHD-15]MDQ8700227.1 Arc family DNA-binding protein [Hyphomicrobium sp. LHD-15]
MKNAKSRFQKPRESIAFRPPQELREKLEGAAEAAGHSLSFEITTRLQQAYSERDWARAELGEAFGDFETMAVVFTIARAAIAVTNRRRAHWLGDRDAWDEARDAIERILYRFAPSGPGQWSPTDSRRQEWETYKASDQFKAAGKVTANELLSLIEIGGQDWWPFGTPGPSNLTKELQRDIIERDELLHVLQKLLDDREGLSLPSDKKKK